MLGPWGQHLMKPPEVVIELELLQLLKGNLPPHIFLKKNISHQFGLYVGWQGRVTFNFRWRGKGRLL